DGYRELGFMGGIAVPAVIRFGYGFVQGAEYAAKELELEEGDVNISYNYTGAFWPLPEIQAMSAAWYEGGTEVIFSCGGGICLSIFASAEAAGTKVIGVDVDQAAESDTVITSAVKGLGASVYSTLEKYYADSFPGGQTLVMEAANDGVGLPMGTSRFETFSQADYDAIFAKLVKGEIPRMVDDGKTVEPSVVPVELVTVNFVE
ncbi:MAG: BMP family ABC transporter substrate-binding protein, partial [Oscillospiraceae bacterium]|nr:BMP family ABC transporter substrate-binding protein [Oscillospiraceae bacterium]